MTQEPTSDPFGYIRPPRFTISGASRIVSVGMQTVEIDSRFTFTQFLQRYATEALGPVWLQSEAAKPEVDQHVLAKHSSHLTSTYRSDPTKPRLRVVNLDIEALDFLRFAYDLYVCADNDAVDAQLLQRFREPMQYQGARFELRVATGMIRAGFRVDLNIDRTVPQPEFYAIALDGTRIAVEAKSAHRNGVLGSTKGKTIAEVEGMTMKEVGIEACMRMKQAIRKVSTMPLFLFYEMTLPTKTASGILGMFEIHMFEEAKNFDKYYEPNGDKHSVNAVFVMNYPLDAGTDRDDGTQRLASAVWLPHKTRHPVSLDILFSIREGIRRTNAIQRTWEERSEISEFGGWIFPPTE